MPDVWNVTAAYDKAAYNKGELIKIIISGGMTTSGSGQSGTLTLTITAANGATTTITMPPVTISGTTTAPQTVKLTSVADTSGRVWTIAADGLSATAIA